MLLLLLLLLLHSSRHCRPATACTAAARLFTARRLQLRTNELIRADRIRRDTVAEDTLKAIPLLNPATAEATYSVDLTLKRDAFG